MSNKRISDLRAGWGGRFSLAAVVFQHSLYYLTPGASQCPTSVFIFATLCCLFTYASDSPGELVKRKIPGPSFRDSFSVGLG